MIKKAYITHEVQAYIIDTNDNNDLIPLENWRANGGIYWIVDRVARKWLAVPENSNPSKCVLSFFLSLGLATEVPELTHYWVVWFHPRASAKVTSRLCPFIVLGAT